MAKTEKIPVTGYEEEVKSLRQKLATLRWLKAECEAAKVAFREAAKAVARSAVGSTFEFVDPEGSSILVSMPDIEKKSNRSVLRPEDLLVCAAGGLEFTGHIETEECYVLSGGYAEWFRTLLNTWDKSGVKRPEGGLEHKVTSRLSVEGIESLKHIVATGAIGDDGDTDTAATEDLIAAAEDLLKKALKAPTVR